MPSTALALFSGLVAWGSAASYSTPSSTEIAQLDLAKPFNTRSEWRLVASHGPPTVDYGENSAPGALHLCLEKPGGACLASPAPMPPPGVGGYSGWEPHYLYDAEPVYPRGRSAPPLLMIVTASMHAGDGGQVVVTQLLKYNRASDGFERVYAHATGTNNNEDVRFVSSGPLEGSVISADPTENAPYGYWVEVNRLTPRYAYKPVLRYRSATRYGDGNPLAVIDSEMPNIEHRLGLLGPGAPLPVPAGPCPKPRMVHMELWCS